MRSDETFTASGDQPVPGPRAADPLTTGRLRAARRSGAGPAALVAFAMLWTVGAGAVDSSGMEGRDDGWGFVVVPLIGSSVVGLPLVLALLAAWCLAHLVPRAALAAALAGALVCAVLGVGLAVAAVSGLATAMAPADTVFALVTVGATLVLLVSLPVVWRARPGA